jgi:hypothetical protein
MIIFSFQLLRNTCHGFSDVNRHSIIHWYCMYVSNHLIGKNKNGMKFYINNCPPKLPHNRYMGLFLRSKNWSVRLIGHLHLVPKWRKHGGSTLRLTVSPFQLQRLMLHIIYWDGASRKYIKDLEIDNSGNFEGTILEIAWRDWRKAMSNLIQVIR